MQLKYANLTHLIQHIQYMKVLKVLQKLGCNFNTVKKIELFLCLKYFFTVQTTQHIMRYKAVTFMLQDRNRLRCSGAVPSGDAGQRKVICDESLVKRSI